MAFQNAKQQLAERTIRLVGEDKVTGKPYPSRLEGYYLGSKVVTTRNGDQATVYTFRTDEGNIGLWGGHTDLDRQMSLPTLGCMTRVSYNGKKSIPGGKTRHDYLVEWDVSQTIELGTKSPSSLESEEVSDTDYDDEEVNAEFDAPTTRRPTAPVTAATVPDAARQAKVKALLAKSKTA